MARADRRRVARAKPAPEHSRYESAYVGTEGLFFQRLRTHAKWAFVFLALVFAVGFVAFGVGSDVQGGIADVIGVGANADTGEVSVSEAREKLEKNPKDAVALRELSRALQNEGRVEEAIQPLRQYTSLRPRDRSALEELAALYVGRANRFRDEFQQQQLEAATLAPGTAVQPPAESVIGQALANQPVTEAVLTQVNQQLSESLGKLRDASNDAKGTYQQIARLAPRDADVQLNLANAAQDAGDTATAIAAYRKFLQLAPEDQFAPVVRQEIQRLQAQAATSVGTTVGGG